MDTAAFISSLVGHLDALQIPYMLAGSVASSLHGEPRSTHDVDIVIEPSEAQVRESVGRCPECGEMVESAAAGNELREGAAGGG